MEVTAIQLVLLVTITGEDLTDDRARAMADAMLDAADELDGWIYNGVERRNYDEVIVVYVGTLEDDDDDA